MCDLIRLNEQIPENTPSNLPDCKNRFEPLVFSFSCLSLPLRFYSLDSAIVNGVYWSEALNKVFVDNFERDPSLIWQYFGSAKGFFRQYPGKRVLVGRVGVWRLETLFVIKSLPC